MSSEIDQKVSASHLKREAYLYVRQSTVRQVFENTESTQRQYGLRQRAVALGWPQERVVVIDSDQGQSGASVTGREGFQKLVGEVGMGHVGIVLGLEVSRLARNSSDWHRLLEICALSDTLILDEDGLYNPCDFNDRLLLGLKGTMSEAELHVLRARLRGGILNQARRGALKTALPVGLVYDPNNQVVLDPDQQVQQSVRHFFRTFQRTGSARATVKAFREEQLHFPRRPRHGPQKGELLWGEICHWRALQILHNPRYAGAFSFGRYRTRKGLDGQRIMELQPREEWIALLPDMHAGYISWEQYEANQKSLRENAQAHGRERRKSPPREGPALLQGLVGCGVCGRRMTVRYHTRQGRLCPDYVCATQGIQTGSNICQHIPGMAIDKAIGTLLVDLVTPVTLEVTLQVQQELEARLEDADRLRGQQVERARYQAELARRRYMQVDPDNRLVADILEAEWNDQLRTLAAAQEEYEQRRAEDHQTISDEQRAQILALATDFPRLWHDPKTPQRERKRMVRLLIEDVTLVKEDQITVHIRFRGGATKSITLPRPLNAWQLRKSPPQLIAEIDRMLDHHTEGEIAHLLNERGITSSEGRTFNPPLVRFLRRQYGLKARYERLRDAGLMNAAEMAELLDVTTNTVKWWQRHGLLRAHAYNGRNECLYDHPGDNPPVKMQGTKLSERRRFSQVMSNRKKGVQCEA